VVVFIALGVPLAINLEQRATLELETEGLIQAQGIAARIGAENMQLGNREVLQGIVSGSALQVGGRVIVVDATGALIADSEGTRNLGNNYANGARPEIDAALSGRPDSQIRFSQELGIDLLAIGVPIQDEQQLVGAVRITEPMSDVRSQTRRTTLGLLAVALAGLASGLLLAWALASSFARPLRRLADASERLGAGDLSARSERVGGAEEIQQLASSFDEMADRLERTVRAQREFVANASHQLRTPLTGMKLRLESAVDQAGDPELRRQLEAADREVDRLAEIVDRLLVMASQIEEGQPTSVDLGDAVTRALARWEDRAARRGASLLARGETGDAQANPTDVDQSWTTCSTTRSRTRRARSWSRPPARTAASVVAIQDRALGIPAEE
jgi:signal transduction histidine kinase